MGSEGLTINSNISALRGQRTLASSTNQLQQSFLRLSSGLRINRASDDAAGLAVAEGLNVDTRVFSQGIRNLNDGLSLLSIAEGGLEALNNIVIRTRELAEQASNGVLTSTQRRALDAEAQTLAREYERIRETTNFNNLALLSDDAGSISLQAAYGELDVSFSSLLQGRFQGDGTFRSVTSFALSAGGAADRIRILDVDGDGNEDLVAGSAGGGSTIRVRYGNGDGTFEAQQSIPLGGSNATGVSVADLNGDGRNDLVAGITGSNRYAVLLGNGDGTYKFSSFNSIGQTDEHELGDVNGDGILDIVGSDQSQAFAVLLGNADGTFKSATTYTVSAGGSGMNDVELGDLNGDGILDVVINDSAGDFTVSLGNGNGTFKFTSRVSPVNGGTAHIDVADINGDGILDVIAGSRTWGSGASVHLGNGNGTFKFAGIFGAAGANFNDVELSDFDGDGYLDFAAADVTNSRLVIQYGNGNGTFRAGVSYAVGATADNLAIGDLNGDGVIDVGISDFGVPGAFNVFFANAEQTGGFPTFSLLTQSSALTALDELADVSNSIALARANLGAHQSRISVAVSNLQTQGEEYSRSRSQIMDVDVAEETARLVRSQILQRAGAAVLQQANQVPQLALQLLRS